MVTAKLRTPCQGTSAPHGATRSVERRSDLTPLFGSFSQGEMTYRVESCRVYRCWGFAFAYASACPESGPEIAAA